MKKVSVVLVGFFLLLTWKGTSQDIHGKWKVVSLFLDSCIWVDVAADTFSICNKTLPFDVIQRDSFAFHYILKATIAKMKRTTETYSKTSNYIVTDLKDNSKKIGRYIFDTAKMTLVRKLPGSREEHFVVAAANFDEMILVFDLFVAGRNRKCMMRLKKIQ